MAKKLSDIQGTHLLRVSGTVGSDKLDTYLTNADKVVVAAAVRVASQVWLLLYHHSRLALVWGCSGDLQYYIPTPHADESKGLMDDWRWDRFTMATMEDVAGVEALLRRIQASEHTIGWIDGEWLDEFRLRRAGSFPRYLGRIGLSGCRGLRSVFGRWEEGPLECVPTSFNGNIYTHRWLRGSLRVYNASKATYASSVAPAWRYATAVSHASLKAALDPGDDPDIGYAVVDSDGDLKQLLYASRGKYLDIPDMGALQGAMSKWEMEAADLVLAGNAPAFVWKVAFDHPKPDTLVLKEILERYVVPIE